MKIVHICPTFTEKLGYQENYLPKYQKRLQYDVTIITSCWVYNSRGELAEGKEEDYVNQDGIRIRRLRYKNNQSYNYKFKRFCGLRKTLEEEQPDILFVHGCQWVYISDITAYLKRHCGVRVYVDNHADYLNSASSWISKNILHKIIWKHYAQMIRPFTEKFYGVLPNRVEILSELYGIPSSECELLCMGADDDLIEESAQPEVIRKIRKMHGIKSTDFLIVSGGKIDSSKQQILTLMQAVSGIDKENLKLLIFGSVSDEMKQQFEHLCKDKVIYAGWISSGETYQYISASDLVVFPFKHSVLWEQTVAQGKPLLVNHLSGLSHIDFGGNVEYLYNDSLDEMTEKITAIVNGNYEQMKKTAQLNRAEFLYSSIAKKSIGR